MDTPKVLDQRWKMPPLSATVGLAAKTLRRWPMGSYTVRIPTKMAERQVESIGPPSVKVKKRTTTGEGKRFGDCISGVRF